MFEKDFTAKFNNPLCNEFYVKDWKGKKVFLKIGTTCITGTLEAITQESFLFKNAKITLEELNVENNVVFLEELSIMKFTVSIMGLLSNQNDEKEPLKSAPQSTETELPIVTHAPEIKTDDKPVLTIIKRKKKLEKLLSK